MSTFHYDLIDSLGADIHLVVGPNWVLPIVVIIETGGGHEVENSGLSMVLFEIVANVRCAVSEVCPFFSFRLYCLCYPFNSLFRRTSRKNDRVRLKVAFVVGVVLPAEDRCDVLMEKFEDL
ncbi:MAG: hypothetical protein J07HX64_00328 [halophilic archaeon J07HX64]|nr:MAG: hypothetical protein J07HX64_00328 [halophilic archaeon J07HX64]